MNKFSYKGKEVEIKNGKFYTKANNGTLRIFNSEELLKNFIDKESVLESHAQAMARLAW